jgi:G:T-mismatch repair DNA endonuclease (very short patch repair protein)
VNRDRLTRERRSWNMSRIRGNDTAPENAVGD